MDNFEILLKDAKSAANNILSLSNEKINSSLITVANALIDNQKYLTEENKKDVLLAEKKGMKPSLIDRLTLTPKTIESMATSLKQVAALPSPLGETVYSYEKENGLKIFQKRVPFGVIGIIYEARPNVTADAFGLCFKTKNACVLKGGSDAINSNIAIVKVIKNALKSEGVNENVISLITDTTRETTEKLIKAKGKVDVVIPRGSAALIKYVSENATVPAIETGSGNCHIYVDEFASVDKAVEIIVNAKTQRYGVCNACESLVIHQNALKSALPKIVKALTEKGVEIRGDKNALKVCPNISAANEEDFYTEYLAPIISVKTVSSVKEAVEHINECSTGHSEAIITENKENAEYFMEKIDSAAVYQNASTRFTDGFEYGLGAEIGISTQKMHARGPMGLKALTTTKFYCYGDGQIRK